MPIKKDARKISSFDGEIVSLTDSEVEIVNNSLGLTQVKEQFLEEITKLKEEISTLKTTLGIDDNETTEESTGESDNTEISDVTSDKEITEEIS